MLCGILKKSKKRRDYIGIDELMLLHVITEGTLERPTKTVEHIGGSAVNPAMWLHHLGFNAMAMTSLVNDPIGSRIINHLPSGMPRHIIMAQQHALGNLSNPQFYHTTQNGTVPSIFHFDRRHSPCSVLTEDNFPEDFFKQNPTRIFGMSSILMGLDAVHEDRRPKTLDFCIKAARLAVESGAMIIFDAGYRPFFWENRGGANKHFQYVKEIMPYVSILTGPEKKIHEDLAGGEEISSWMLRNERLQIVSCSSKELHIDNPTLAKIRSRMFTTNTCYQDEMPGILVKDFTGDGDADRAALLCAIFESGGPNTLPKKVFDLSRRLRTLCIGSEIDVPTVSWTTVNQVGGVPHR